MAGESKRKRPARSVASRLDEAERRRLLIEFNATSAQFPSDLCIHQLFEQQVERSPEEPAVKSGGQTLSYAQLNARANQLARLLREHGVVPDSQVALLLPRSIEAVAAIIGTLKAGGAYVPLNPADPPERLRHQLTGVKIVISDTALASRLRDFAGTVICLDQQKDAIEKLPTQNLSPTASPGDLVYVIYTSGSTGVPKGVGITHRALVNYATFIQRKLASDQPMRFATVSTFSTDLGNTCIFPSLISGGCLDVVDTELARDPDALAKHFAENPADVLKIVPSHLSAMLEAAHCEHILPRQYLILGGETFSWDLLRRIDAIPHTCKTINHYGPTETTVGALTFDVAHVESSRSVPIGCPVANAEAYILDEEMQPVPIGESGELYLGGAGLARGYIGLPKQTAERFVPHPFSAEPDAQLYRTGDLARHLPDGNIEFLGRADHQVKVRGFRIELAEIESLILQHPGIRDGVVVARDFGADKRLLAYFTPAHPGTIDEAQLRAWMEERLPAHMMPSFFVPLQRLPLNPSGKVDRGALPSPEVASDQAAIFVPPRTDTEKAVARIWTKLLNIEHVSADANFFHLGGHSLLATLLVSRLRREFSVDFPMRVVFEHPTITGISEAIGDLQTTTRTLPAQISARKRKAAVPASFAQRRLWILDQFQPGSTGYNMVRAVEIPGLLDQAALKSSILEIVRRHEVLRTRFAAVDGEAVQIIEAEPNVEIPFVEFNSASDAEFVAQTKSAINEELARPFDLAQGPLLRVRLLRHRLDKHVLLVAMHHIVSDAWSMTTFFEELAALYEAFYQGRPSSLPDLPIQYADYSEWQLNSLRDHALDKLLGYWKQQLAGAPQNLSLPTDRSHPAISTHRAACEVAVFDKNLASGLRELSRREGVTLYMVMLATFQTLLWRYTGQDDIVVGSPIAGRQHPETEALIGFFVNTLVLRARFADNPTFRELLAQVRETALAAYDHQELPFEKLVEELNPERNLNRNPLVQVLFALDSAPMPANSGSSLRLNPLDVDVISSIIDLEVHVAEREDQLVYSFIYSEDLFDRSTIRRMVAHFECLLRGIVAEPARKVSRIALLTPAERQQMLVDWNATQMDFDRTKCLHHLFEQQVEHTPEATSIRFENEQLTYAELNRRANRLAHYLQAQGIRPDDRVGICLSRSISMLVAMLGVLKAGAAYVPLDPEYPQERLRYMLEDCGAAAVLTENRLQPRVGDTANLIRLDFDTERIGSKPDTNPSSAARPNNLAYVIYTSGSTGKPKGVAIEHRSTVAFLNWAGTVFATDELAGVLAGTSICFDLSIFEFFVTLSYGGTVILIENISHLPRLPAREQVTLINTVPSAMAELIGLNAVPRGVRTINLAGEPLQSSLVDQIYRETNATRVYDLYGPSETTTYSTYTLRRPKAAATIGKPIANTQVYVLDRHGEPVPQGVPGELYIGGEGLARGYLNRPELTSEKFVPDPFSEQKEKRLYRTGDLARWLSSGELQYMGRIDHQVKLRGFRIELGEVEATLRAHSSVRESVVIAREDAPGEKRLVAYVVSHSGAKIVREELRSFLRNRLPEYMVPSAIEQLESMPLTPNGKVDRRALPSPEAPEQEGYVAPRTQMEAKLAEVWSGVLGIPRIGIHDNFFALGGHSLMAMRLIGRIRQELGLEVSIRALFENPTIAGLSLAAGTPSLPVSPPLPAITRAARVGLGTSKIQLPLPPMSDEP